MTAPVQPGDVLAGKYRVESVLGVGGMGVVVRAIHEQLGQPVALKFLLSSALTSPDALARFEREARAIAALRTEHVIRIQDFGTLDGGEPYIVMEFLDGTDLEAVLEAEGPLPVSDVADYLLQACEAIAEAHRAGIIHRDLKPANLFRTTRADGTPLVKVLDFGIAKTLAEGDEASLTRSSAGMGSPYYISPEQLQSARDVDPRTDVWALGVVLFELLTGRHPFEGDSLPALSLQILQAPHPRLSEINPDLPLQLGQLVDWCLHKDRETRCPTVAHFARALEPFAPSHAHVSVQRVSRMLGESRTSLSAPPISDPRSVSQTLISPGVTGAERSDPNELGPTRGAWGTTNAGRRTTRGSRGALLGGLVALSALAAAAIWLTNRQATSSVVAEPSDSASATAVEPAASAGPSAMEAPPRPSRAPAAEPTPSASGPAAASAGEPGASPSVLDPPPRVRPELPPPAPNPVATPAPSPRRAAAPRPRPAPSPPPAPPSKPAPPPAPKADPADFLMHRE